MTRKDYELIAAAVRDARDDLAASPRTSGVVDLVAGHLATALRGTNPRFDSVRFLRATKEPGK